MTMNIRELEAHYYSLGQDTTRTKQSSYAGLGTAGVAASRLAPTGLRNVGTGLLAYQLPGMVLGTYAGGAGLLGDALNATTHDGLSFGGLIGSTVGKLLQDINTLRIANKLTRREAKRVFEAIPDYGLAIGASSASPLYNLGDAIEKGYNSAGLYAGNAAINLGTDLLVRKRLLQKAGLK